MKVKELYNYFREKLSEKCEFVHDLKQLSDYAATIDNGAYLIVVVGSVKSGKSTFLNLISKAEVCSTDSDECTIYPGLIIHGDNKYRTFKANRSINSDDKLYLVEEIVSSLVKKSEFSNPNVNQEIKQYSEACVRDSCDKSNKYLCTSFEVEGGNLLNNNQNIIWVDMPGLDGKYSNFDSIQNSILSRADAIIFVQSSASAMTDGEVKVLNKIHENNPSVYMTLLMNVIDSKIFQEDDPCYKEAQEKLEKYIKEHCFSQFKNLKDLSVVVNLEIVRTLRDTAKLNEGFRETAEKDNKILEDFVKKYSEEIIQNSSKHRRETTEERIEIRKKTIINTLSNKVSEIEREVSILKKNKSKLEDEIRKGSELLDDLTFSAEDPYKDIKNSVNQEVNRFYFESFFNSKKSFKKQLGEFFDVIKNISQEQYKKTGKDIINKLNSEIKNSIKKFNSINRASISSPEIPKDKNLVDCCSIIEENKYRVGREVANVGFCKSFFRLINNKDLEKSKSNLVNNIIGNEDKEPKLFADIFDDFKSKLKEEIDRVKSEYKKEYENSFKDELSKYDKIELLDKQCHLYKELLEELNKSDI